MSTRLFQSVIHQMRDAIERTVGIVDTDSVIIACSELGMIGNSVELLVTENQPEGAVILLLDKTEEELRETLRREFTSNVSHELKTPLTSIFGISEILSEGIVRPEDIPKFSKSIYDETGRLRGRTTYAENGELIIEEY